MTMRKKIFATVAALAITASTALTGAAQDATTATSSITIGAGAFTTSLSASNFANLPYSLTDQTALGGRINLLVNDQTGDGDGWQVTLTLTDFIGQSRSGMTPIPSENLNITAVQMTVATSGSQAISEANMKPVYGETAPQLTWTADPGYGAGAYNLNMTADLLIPGRTTAQTYTSTGTVEIVAGP